MGNSSLVNYTKLSPNHSGARTHSIDRITPHCVVGQCSVETLGNIFMTNGASCNYGIGTDGRVLLCVEEKNRSWCSSSNANDQRAVTIECASDTYDPYAMNSKVYDTLVKLCTDICKRNGKKKLLWFGSESKTLNYSPKSDEMVVTVHRWFANKSCPGDWLYSRLGDLASKVTSNLGGSSTSSSSSSSSSSNSSTSSSSSNSGSSSIKAVQTWCNTNYKTGITVDGIYGIQTKKALVKVLQTEMNKQYGSKLVVDGIYGSATNSAVRNLTIGCSGNITKTLQALLICNGLSTNGFDGVYGNGTANAVKSYQQKKGLTVDGIAGKATFSSLCK